MPHLNTVLGAIHPKEMGITAIHEHLMWGLSGWELDPNSWFDISEAFEKCYHDLIDFRLLAGRTYVDCSAIGQGRDINLYTKMASATGIHIVASTGFAGEDLIAPHFRSKDIDYFEELLVHEITRGMGHTSVKAGIIKVANSKKEFTEMEETQYRAAARAAKRTGAAIITEGVHLALRQLEILLAENLDPSRIIVGHLDSKDQVDLERDKQIARSGAYVAYDQIGIEDIWCREWYAMSDNIRVELVLAMLNSGFQDRILLSSGSIGWRLGAEPFLHNVGHTIRCFTPKLMEAGVSQEVIHGILAENPKHVLPIQ